MSAQKFIRLEHLSMKPLSLLILVTMVSLFLLIFFILSSDDGYKKRLVLFFTSLTAICFLATFFLYSQVENYNDIARYINPGLRDRQAGSLGYKYYSFRQQSSFQSFYQPESLEKIPFYERKEIIIPLDYLGTRRSGENMLKKDSQLIFSFEKSAYKELDQAQMVLYQYFLKDKELLAEGFTESTRPFFIRLELPLQDQGLSFPENNKEFENQEELSLKSSFPSYIFP